MMIDTELCETCAYSPRVWGYNDCQRCLNEQHRWQLQGFAPLIFCQYCQTDVLTCLHLKMEARLRETKPNPLQTMPVETLWEAYRAVESCLMYESYGRDEEARINDMNERGRYCKELKRRGGWGRK